MDSLFVALRSYRPTAGRDPMEDFITEAWAWLLRNDAPLCERFEVAIRSLVDSSATSFGHCAIAPEQLPRGWRASSARTQVNTGGGRADMVVDAEQGGVVFEHKTWSAVRTNQLEPYRTWAARTFGPEHLVILVTGSRSQWVSSNDSEASDPHIELTWGFIERVCLEHAATSSSTLVEDFVHLLQSEGLGAPGPLTEESLRAYGPAQEVVPRLRRLWRSLASDERLLNLVYSRVVSQGDDQEPALRWKRGDLPREGRFGLDMFVWWRPGIFVGAMLDPTDHRVEWSRPHLGPDFALILSYSRKPDANPHADAFWGSAEVAELRERLRREREHWDLVDRVDNLTEPDVNPWHLIHLRRPLAKVLRGTRTFEEQRAALLAAAGELLDLLLRGGEIAAWVARVRDAVPRSERR